ncbi:hypothetical protein KR51_00020050 [Rubidibacter lacunae KORDI 51-2]|uniref:DUF2330 domain-containing protein n=1 Tax=Rubidibacter lacunae KORDI 51-2 TaxID=582515 RepID=U5DA21_9CHRO|nr:DUF2330 domain-containing protein [Rubidibacter lacunae]ERN41433.1 hypothetical protein KR51_00020050 [Rubidibacter lacunae KORDI 51-2]
MKRFIRIVRALGFAIAIALLVAAPARAFCGFYVSQANAELYNQASQVIIARDGDRTILTMANDYQGDVQDFALVVPVPVLLKEDQVRVGDPKIIQRLDSFSAPRLVEYFDANPCDPVVIREVSPSNLRAAPSDVSNDAEGQLGDRYGVTVEERFSLGEYDILILSAKESNGLEDWLRANDYNIPEGASRLLQPYIRQNLKFFVAKVNLEEYAESEFQSLRPLLMAFESPRFMLPIRLGTVNAKGPQDLLVYLLSPTGQVELANYRTVNVPSDVEIPEFVQGKFGDFYTSMFDLAYQRENRRVAFREYAWNMANCDPCSAPQLTPDELRAAGVFWAEPGTVPNLFITRLHVRYTFDDFPEDLRFQTTPNQQFFQGRYVIRHPFRGNISCAAGREYRRQLRARQLREMQTLAQLTGWNLPELRQQPEFIDTPTESDSPPWWRRVWN